MEGAEAFWRGVEVEVVEGGADVEGGEGFGGVRGGGWGACGVGEGEGEAVEEVG